MKKIGLIIWPLKGNVEKAALEIKKHFTDEEIDVLDLSTIKPQHLLLYENIILGSSTVGADHWEDATDDNKWYKLFHEMDVDNVDYTGKKVALYGLGDQVNYPHNFVDGMERVYSHIVKHNITLVGEWENKGYDFKDSLALHNNKFRGLALDLDNDEENAKQMIAEWIEILKKEF